LFHFSLALHVFISLQKDHLENKVQQVFLLEKQVVRREGVLLGLERSPEHHAGLERRPDHQDHEQRRFRSAAGH